jgi:hypothetical protein
MNQCQLNNTIRINDKLNTNWNYRNHLQTNAKSIINHNTTNALIGIPTIINRKYNPPESDLKQFLKQKNICCPSIIM